MGRHPDIEPGSTLGPYVICRRAGQGGQATVWEAELVGPPSLRKRVALKVRTALSGELHREHRLGRLLRHENIVEVYDVGEASGRAYLSLEWVDGPSLEARIRAEPLPPRAVVELGIGLAEALAHLHSRGLIHRDLSPANVLLTSGGVPKLADLGLAVFAAEQATTRRAGTPGYVSPEQSRGEDLDGRTDIWALGAVLARAATGRHLLGRRVPVDLNELHVARAAVTDSLSAYPPLARIIAAMTSPEPSQRPDARQAAAWLRQLRGDRPPGRGLRPSGDDHQTSTAVVRQLGNVARPSDAFFGRSEERAELQALLGCGGVVTVHGPGGMGKTRLVREVVAHAEPPGGAWVVDLSAVQRVEQLCAAVAAVLSVPLGTEEPLAVLGHALAGRPPLWLVLDNAGHAVEAVSRAVATWSGCAPTAGIVVTSREILGVHGEQVLALRRLPDADQRDLFGSRAEARGWAGGGADAVDRLLAMVDGVPLAVELAAVQAAEVGVEQVLVALTSPEAEAPGLHPAMSAALTVSWSLLDTDQRSAMAQLTVFEGGFAADDADTVLDLSEPAWALDVLDALLDKSLLYSWDAGSGPRFAMYEPVLQYAATKLDAAARSAAEQRHGEHFASLRDSALLRRAQLGEQAAHRLLLAERANLSAALERAHRRHDAMVAAAVAEILWHVIERAGPLSDAVSTLELALEVPGLQPIAHALLLAHLGEAQRALGRPAVARPLLEDSLARCEALGCSEERGRVLGYLGVLDMGEGRPADAQAHCEAALVVNRALGHRRAEGAVLCNLGVLHHDQGQVARSRALYEAALALSREVGDRSLEGIVLGNLGNLHRDQGRMSQAETHYLAALGAYRTVGYRRHEGVVLGNLGVVYSDLGRLQESSAHYEAALTVLREVGNRHHEGIVLGNLGTLHLDRDRPAEAEAAFRAALVVHEEVNDHHSLGVVHCNLGDLLLRRGDAAVGHIAMGRALEHAQRSGFVPLEGVARVTLARAALAEGDLHTAQVELDAGETLLRSVNYQVELCSALCVRAELSLRQGARAAAVEALGEARRSLDAMSMGGSTPLARDLERVAAVVWRS